MLHSSYMGEHPQLLNCLNFESALSVKQSILGKRIKICQKKDLVIMIKPGTYVE